MKRSMPPVHSKFHLTKAIRGLSIGGLLPVLFSALLWQWGLAPRVMVAGPPYFTDDPEPALYRHGEFYAASQFQHTRAENAATLPPGDKNKGLGSGETQVFLPLWFQKSWGPWTTCGGGGYWINPGEGNQNWWFFGWLLQREISKKLSVRAELFHKTISEAGGESSTGFNFGAVVNLTENHHILLSAGRDFDGPNLFTSYMGYQFTFGGN